MALMAKSEDRRGEPGRPPDSRMEEGYVQQSLQLPKALRDAWRDDIATKGTGAVKNVGTMLVALYLGMPEDVRKTLFKDTLEDLWGGPENIDPKVVYKRFLSLVAVRTVPILPDSSRAPRARAAVKDAPKQERETQPREDDAGRSRRDPKGH